MISRIESNCQTGEIKYFDQNENEIPFDLVQAEIIAGQQIVQPTQSPEGNEPLPADEPSEG